MSILDFESTTKPAKPIFGLPLWVTEIKTGGKPIRQYGNTDHQSFLRALNEYNRQCAEAERLVS